MVIGLDIDNVISAFDEKILQNILIEDKKKRNAGIVNPKGRHITKGMFDWSEEEMHDFFADNMEMIAKDLRTRRDCKKYMNKLIEDGHTLVLISHRASQCKKMRANGIECIMMLTKYNKKETDGMPYAKSWADLYKEISQWKK